MVRVKSAHTTGLHLGPCKSPGPGKRSTIGRCPVGDSKRRPLDAVPRGTTQQEAGLGAAASVVSEAGWAWRACRTGQRALPKTYQPPGCSPISGRGPGLALGLKGALLGRQHPAPGTLTPDSSVFETRGSYYNRNTHLRPCLSGRGARSPDLQLEAALRSTPQPPAAPVI